MKLKIEFNKGEFADAVSYLEKHYDTTEGGTMTVDGNNISVVFKELKKIANKPEKDPIVEQKDAPKEVPEESPPQKSGKTTMHKNDLDFL